MSEPVTNAEIEDVLSSIRRLVSEDVRNTVREHVEIKREEPDRLVLSPALRVADPEIVSVSENDHSEAGDAFPGAEDEASFDVQDANAALDDSNSINADEHAAQELSTPWEDPGATLYEAAAAIEGENLQERQDEADGEERTALDDEALLDAASLEVREDHGLGVGELAENDTVVDDDLQNLSAKDPQIEEEQTETPVSDELSISVEAETDEQILQPEATAHHPEEAEPEEDGGVRLSAAVEALSAAMSDSDDVEWEPHGDEATEATLPDPEPLEWQDADGPEASQATPSFAYIDEDPEDDEPEDALFDDEDETVLDEAMLRELVTDIVREELQGALGERITRNVRKLVRREINRALSVQDLE